MTTFPLAPRVAATLTDIHVEPGGLKAVAGTETFEGDSAPALAKKLAAGLYQILHMGRSEPLTSRPRSFRDRDLDHRLAGAMPHERTRTQALIHTYPPEHNETIVELDGLRVRMPPEAVITPLPETPPGPVTVTLPAARPGLSPGFFLADGSLGNERSGDMLRLYVHLTHPEAAPDAWHTVLTHLEQAGLPYRAKVSSSPHLYPRRDALVVYLGPRAQHAVFALAERLKGLDGVGESTSPFTREVAPGIGVAWEPTDRRAGHKGQSFGEHRTAILAEALVQHALLSDEDRTVAAEMVASAFLDASIDPLDPARNLSSPPIPVLSPA
ncbi:T3SS effector HopA1 family protein [Streptomyces sp. NPDC086549]|uniref:T3SS effector HopA1 family protein n=1 Tax=Streptomyces sp. NPDC086549 TaxID=3365752 RepID=UPI003800832B